MNIIQSINNSLLGFFRRLTLISRIAITAAAISLFYGLIKFSLLYLDVSTGLLVSPSVIPLIPADDLVIRSLLGIIFIINNLLCFSVCLAIPMVLLSYTWQPDYMEKADGRLSTNTPPGWQGIILRILPAFLLTTIIFIVTCQLTKLGTISYDHKQQYVILLFIGNLMGVILLTRLDCITVPGHRKVKYKK